MVVPWMVWAVASPGHAAELPEQAACEQGEGAACLKLGDAFARGQGVPTDRFKAVQLYRRGCDLGHAPACMFLAEAYRTGDGTRAEPERALELYTQACELGNPLACRSVGDLFNMGALGAADGKAAGVFYALACDLGDAQSCTAAGLWFERGDLGSADPAKAQRLYATACQLGHGRGCTLLGIRYQRGSDGAPRDPVKAAEWFTAGCGAATSDPEACREVGLALLRGKEVLADPLGARDALEKACWAGDGLGCRHLSVLLLDQGDAAGGLVSAERGCDLGDRTACKVATKAHARMR